MTYNLLPSTFYLRVLPTTSIYYLHYHLLHIHSKTLFIGHVYLSSALHINGGPPGKAPLGGSLGRLPWEALLGAPWGPKRPPLRRPLGGPLEGPLEGPQVAQTSPKTASNLRANGAATGALHFVRHSHTKCVFAR